MDNIAVTPFQFQENITLRTVSLEGEHWFVAKDVAEALGYANPSDAVKQHCKGVAKRYPLRTTGGTQEFRIIREPDLYRLIVGSTLPAAQEFEAWIFEEVLPTLRRTGNYAIPPKSAAYARRVEAARPGPEWHTMREIATAWNMDRRSAALRITRMQRWGEVEIRASESRWQPYFYRFSTKGKGNSAQPEQPQPLPKQEQKITTLSATPAETDNKFYFRAELKDGKLNISEYEPGFVFFTEIPRLLLEDVFFADAKRRELLFAIADAALKRAGYTPETT